MSDRSDLPPAGDDDHMTKARDRAIGALVGLAVGDAVGATVEFMPPGSFKPVEDMVGGGPHNLLAGQWTDDTSMAMCLAESILDTGAMDFADQLRRYVAWLSDGYWSSKDHCFDIGNATHSALSRFARTGEVVDSVIDPEAAANGSLMRLAPVPIRWYADLELAAQLGGESSRPTHPASRPVDACRLYSAMIAALIGGAPFEEVSDPGFWRFGDLDPTIEAIARGSWRSKEPPEIRGTGYVVDALEAAIWSVAGAANAREAILRAANLGDDADTTAAIAGQLAGARWGYSGIPTAWRERITHSERIAAIAGRLFAIGSESPMRSNWPHEDLIHGYWVEPGVVLAGEYPGHLHDQSRTEAKINTLVDYGIRTFVDLTHPDDGMAPYQEVLDRVARQRGVDLRRIPHPIPDMGVLPVDEYAGIVATIRSAAERGGTFIHCWGGIGRTGTVVGALLIDSGMGFDDAISEIVDLRLRTRKSGVKAPQSEAQFDVLRRLAALGPTDA